MDGFEIPIGGDLSSLHDAFSAVISAVEAMGDKITQALEKSNAQMIKAQQAMSQVASGAGKVETANKQAGSAIGATAAKLSRAAATAGNLGNAMIGLNTGLSLANRTSRALAGVNLVASLTSWANRTGGLRSAFAKIPAAMNAIASNPTFRKIAIGAGLAVAGILTIRMAWKTVSAGAHALGRTAAGVFRGMVTAGKAAARAISGAFRGISAMPGKLAGGIPGLPIAGVLGAAGAVALLTSQLKGASESASVFEDMSVSIEHFMGSAKSANALLADLANFGNVTPFETVDVQQTAEGLLGAGIRDDVAGITKDLAAMARNGQELRELGDALGKGFAKGKFQTEEVNKFLERGINLMPALQTAVGLTGKEFQKAVEEGLRFDTVTRAIRSMSREGGQMFGLLEKRSQTFTGLISTLQSAWTDIRKNFGTPINDALKPILQKAIASIGSLMKKATVLGEKVGNSIRLLFAAFETGKSLDVFKAGLKVAFFGATDILMRGMRGAVGFLATALPPIFSALTAKLADPSFWSGISLLLQAAAAAFSAELHRAMGDQETGRRLDQQFNMQQQHGARLVSDAGNVDLGKVIAQALGDGAEAAKKAAGGPKSANLVSAEQALEKLMTSFQRRVDAEKSADEIFGALLKKPGSAVARKPESTSDAIQKAVAPAVMSLSRIGGGGFANAVFSSLVTESRKHTSYLKTLVAQGVNKPNKVTAVYS